MPLVLQAFIDLTVSHLKAVLLRVSGRGYLQLCIADAALDKPCVTLIPRLPAMADKARRRRRIDRFFSFEKTNSLESMDSCCTICTGSNSVHAVMATQAVTLKSVGAVYIYL